jgi:hypothetical protein
MKTQIPQNYNTISRNKQAISGIQELIGPERSSSQSQARAPGNGHEISPRPGLELGFMAWVSGPDKTDEAERQRAEGGDTDLVGGGRRRAVVMGRGEGTRNPIRWGVSRSESGPTRCGSRPITGGGFVAVVGFGSALRDGRPRCHHVCLLLASVWWAELVFGWSLEVGGLS